MRIQLANAIEVLNNIAKNTSLKILHTKEDRYLLSDVFEHLKSENGLQFLSSWLKLQVCSIFIKPAENKRNYILSHFVL